MSSIPHYDPTMYISGDPVIHCLDASGEPYGVPFSAVHMATGRPRCLIRCRDGTEHRVAVREERVRLGLPRISLAELQCIAPVLTGEAFRRACVPGSAFVQSPPWIAVRRDD